MPKLCVKDLKLHRGVGDRHNKRWVTVLRSLETLPYFPIINFDAFKPRFPPYSFAHFETQIILLKKCTLNESTFAIFIVYN